MRPSPPTDPLVSPPEEGQVLSRWLAPVRRFLRLEAAGGIMIMAFAAAALLWVNSPFAASYNALWHARFHIGPVGGGLDLTIAHWVNDGLMAVFFLLVGLEMKREVLIGELSSPRRAALPLIGALGGTMVPALLYIAVVMMGGERSMLRGWAVPMATDIAFALGVLALLGKRAPSSLKIFLVALAIADDLAAVLVIAIFYTASVSTFALGWAAAIVFCLIAINRLGVRMLTPYVLLGVALWVAVHESGVHATIAGVVLAMTIPASRRRGISDVVPAAREQLQVMSDSADASTLETDSLFAIRTTLDEYTPPLVQLEHALHPWVTYAILPLFALANAGVAATSVDAVRGAAPLGILAGLFVGKPVGVFLASALAIALRLAERPTGVSWRQLLGVSCLCGIGFTMSIFISALAFAEPATLDAAKLAILGASILSSIAGALVLAKNGDATR